MKRSFLFIFFIWSTGIYAQQTVEIWLQSRMNGVMDLDNGTTTNYWGFGQYTPPIVPLKVTLPGPLLRFVEGDTAVVHFLNNSAEDHTIHWHGLDVDQANDGVPTTSAPVTPFSDVTYTFTLNHSGAFNYHCHVMTTQHLSMGMYGMIVVDPDTNRNTIYSGGPSYTQDYNWLASELNQNWTDNPLSPGLFTLYEATSVLLNGKSGSQLLDGTFDIVGTTDDTIAVRLSNMGYGKVQYVFPAEANAVAHMSDGRVLPTTIVSDTITVYPGERFTVILNPDVAFSGMVEILYEDLRKKTQIGSNQIPIHIQGASLDEISLENLFQIQGNPINDILRIDVLSKDITSFGLFNLSGKEISTFTVQQGMNELPFVWNQGMYLLRENLTGRAIRIIH